MIAYFSSPQVFVYGATGAGKTHTMLGSAENPGITFKTVMELYKRIEVSDRRDAVYNQALGPTATRFQRYLQF